MEIQPVDPRDTEAEIDSPSYRVYFWERLPTEEGMTPGYKSYENEITEARDVNEVLQWVEANVGGRTYKVYVVVDGTLVRLAGQDPTAAG